MDESIETPSPARHRARAAALLVAGLLGGGALGLTGIASAADSTPTPSPGGSTTTTPRPPCPKGVGGAGSGTSTAPSTGTTGGTATPTV